MMEYFPFSKGWEVLKGRDLLLLNWSVCTVMGLCPTHCDQQEHGHLETQLQLESVFEGDCSVQWPGAI